MNWFHKSLTALCALTVAFSSVQAVTAEEENSEDVSVTAVYRLYNPNSGEHFYTKDINEMVSVVNAG